MLELTLLSSSLLPCFTDGISGSNIVKTGQGLTELTEDLHESAEVPYL